MPVCSQKNIWRNKVYGVEMPSSRLKRLHYALERSWLRKKCRRFTINNVWLLHCSRMEIIHAPIGLYPNYATVSTVGTVCEFITSERTRRKLWSYLDTYDVDVSLATLRHECSSAVVYRCTTVSCVADLHTAPYRPSSQLQQPVISTIVTPWMTTFNCCVFKINMFRHESHPSGGALRKAAVGLSVCPIHVVVQVHL